MSTPLERIKTAVSGGHLDAEAADDVEALVALVRTAAAQIESGYADSDYSVMAALRSAADVVSGGEQNRAGTNEEASLESPAVESVSPHRPPAVDVQPASGAVTTGERQQARDAQEQSAAADEAVKLRVSGPDRLAANEPGTWIVQASKGGRPAAGVGVLAQIGHGSGRPLREATDAQGRVEFEFAFRMPASTIIQFATAGTGPASARFPSQASDVVVMRTLIE